METRKYEQKRTHDARSGELSRMTDLMLYIHTPMAAKLFMVYIILQTQFSH